MTKRKVSLIGPSTLMISLPSKWVKAYGVKKGDELNIDTSGRNLIIETSDLKKSKPLIIDVCGMNANLVRYNLYAAYRGGFDKIRITFDEDNISDENINKKVLIFDVIDEVVSNLIGIEISSQKESSVNIIEISSVNHEEFLNTLKRIFISLMNTSSDMKDAIESKNKTVLKRIGNLSDKKINRLCDFCSRIINKGGIVESDKIPQYYSLISVLEEIGDSMEKICKLNLENSFFKEVKLLNLTLESLYKLFCNYNSNNLKEFYLLKNKLKNIECNGRMELELSKISSYMSKTIPEIVSLNM